jgi:hypothetical protein
LFDKSNSARDVREERGPVCSSESLFELMLRVLRVFERREGIESREQEDKSSNSMVGAHLRNQ